MKTNLVYIITLVTIIIALNYIHIHPDPYCEYDISHETPFFMGALEWGNTHDNTPAPSEETQNTKEKE